MVFSSTIFIFFFLPIVLLLYYNPVFKGRKFKNIVLLIASLGFYAWGEPVFVFLMIFSIIVGWWIGLRLDEKVANRKIWLIMGTVFFVLLLFGFKYLTFLANELGMLLNKDLSMINITLPIGISFFVFQLMSYLFDVYMGKAGAQKNVLYVGLYISLFPQLIAGPIVRYEQIAYEIVNRKETKDDICEGMERFIWGLAKKVLIANYVAQIADNIFNSAYNLSVATAWMGALAYTLQIYFDFSGYSDMAIGLGRMFGFHFSENFNYPYTARSVTDFWRKWHISLSTWFRDYVYIPLGGNRVGKGLRIRNLFIVWALTGIWHGANWTFLIWGLFYFVLLFVEKTTGFAEKLKWGSRIYAIIAVMIGWVIFRSNNMTEALRYVGYMFGVNVSGLSDTAFFYYLMNGKYVLAVAVLLCFPIFPMIKKRLPSQVAEVGGAVLALFTFLLTLVVIVNTTYNPFIYFNF